MSGAIAKKRRTLADAEEDVHQYQTSLADARNKMIILAKENARMKILLQKYMEKDESLLCTSQLMPSQSQSQSQSQNFNRSNLVNSSQQSMFNCSQHASDKLLNSTKSATSQTTSSYTSSHTSPEISASTDTDLGSSSGVDSSQFSTFDENSDFGQTTSIHDEFVFDSQLSQLSELGCTSHLDEILSFLDKQDQLDSDRLSSLQAEVIELRKLVLVPRVGVGVIITSPDHPNCVLIGVRKGSHGAGRLALPGGHLDFGESWESCAAREVKEETNIDLDELKFTFLTNDVMIEEEKHYITIFMQATLKRGQKAELMEPNKCEGWIWQNYESLKSSQYSDLLFLPLKQLLSSKYSPFT